MEEPNEYKKPKFKSESCRQNLDSKGIKQVAGIPLEKIQYDFQKLFLKQGAIPKASTYNWTYKRWNEKSNRYKWYRNLNENNFKGERSPSNSVLSMDSDNEPRKKELQSFNSSLPFYYIIPDRPSQINILPPGKYLVIPQKTIPKGPLKVVLHNGLNGRSSNTDQSNKNPSGSKKSDNSEDNHNKNNRKDSARQRGYKSRSNSMCYESELPSKMKTKATVKGRKESSCQLEPELLNVRIKKDLEQTAVTDAELNDALLQLLMDKLPFLDGEILKFLWSQNIEMDVDLFIAEMINKRINEVCDRIREELPEIDEVYLYDNIRDIMNSDIDVRNFIEAEKLRRNQIFNKLRLFIDVKEDEFNYFFYRFQGKFALNEEDNFLETLTKEIKIMRETERKAQQLQIICNILPDVDSAFVMSRLDNFNGGENDVNELLEELLENPNYPKAVDMDPKNREKCKLWKYYISNYSVDNYLKKVPDPEEYFSKCNVNRNIDKDAAIAFLEKRYSDLDIYQVEDAFTSSNRSIVNTCALLDKNYLFSSTIDESLKKKNLNENFLQEIVFVVHKNEILKHISDEKERRNLEFLKAEEENTFSECLICFASNIIPSETVTCPDGHISCRSCLIKYIETLFGEGKSVFPCLSGTCDMEYTMKTIENSLKPELFTKIIQRRAAEDVDKAEVPGLEKCPSCDYAYILRPNDKIFTCLNEDCLNVTCRFCKEPNHIPLSCEEVERPKDLVARQRIEEAMSEKLIRSCPNCNKKFIKIDGCNKMACPCGTLSCYICLAVVKDYSHFNGQGGSEFHKCPLFSENEKLHVMDVNAAGVQMKETLLREDPDIKFVYDPTLSDEST